MKKYYKWMSLAATLACGIFMACGEEDSVSGFALDDSFEIVLDKFAYTYNSKDSSLKFIPSVCKEGSLGNLVWRKASEDTVKSKAYLNKSVITLVEDGDTSKFDFDGSKLATGYWTPKGADKVVNNAWHFKDGKSAESVFRYKGDCFAKDVYTRLLKGVDALESADDALTDFYSIFQKSSYELDSAEMVKDISAPNCEEIYMYDGLVKIKIESIDETKGSIELSYGESSCDLSYQLRYMSNEEDCNAAYADYKDDDYSADEFDFYDYSEDVVYNEYCVARMALAMKEEQGISLKKESTQDMSRDLARAAVRLVLPR